MTCTETSMDALRHSGDELADAVVATLFERGEVGKFNSLMRYVSTTGQQLPDGLPGVAREYLRTTGTPPDWVDWEEMERARAFFLDNNVHISTALSFASMPACYVVPHVARLLSATHGLDYPSKRMAETGQFTVYLMQPDAFEAGGRFIPAAQKVRLLHAAIRHHLKREDRWDTKALGVPICQEDMIGGQMFFSCSSWTASTDSASTCPSKERRPTSTPGASSARSSASTSRRSRPRSTRHAVSSTCTCCATWAPPRRAST